MRFVNNVHEGLKQLGKQGQTKDRAVSLLKNYPKKENESRKASGVDELHDELNDLLEEWCQLMATISGGDSNDTEAGYRAVFEAGQYGGGGRVNSTESKKHRRASY